MSGVSTVVSTAYSASSCSDSKPARTEALTPSAQFTATTGRAGSRDVGNIVVGRAEHHHDVAAAAVV